MYVCMHLNFVLRLCAANECTVTDNGLVHSFDGITQVAPAEFLSILATTQLDFADDCNFENRIHMEKHVRLVVKTTTLLHTLQ